MTTLADRKAHADAEMTRMGWRIRRSSLQPDPFSGFDYPWYRVETVDGFEAEAPLSNIMLAAHTLADARDDAKARGY